MNKQQYQKRNARFDCSWKRLKVMLTLLSIRKTSAWLFVVAAYRHWAMAWFLWQNVKFWLVPFYFLIFLEKKCWRKKPSTKYYLLRNVFKFEGANMQRSAWQLLITRSYFKDEEKKTNSISTAGKLKPS